MRQISFQQKMEVIELYLEGFSTNDIVDSSQISKGAVISILKDVREGKLPDLELKDRIDELHTLSMRLRKNGLDLEQARLGFAFLSRLLDMGLEPDKLREWVDFNSEISPAPPEGFIPVAMELFNVKRATGKSYAEIAAEAKELSSQREKLASEVENLKADEIRAKELKGEVDKAQKEVSRLMVEKNNLEDTLRTYVSFIEKRAERLGISPDEFEARFKELVSLEEEIASNRGQKNRLAGEIEALSERQEKLSCRMEKASADFERDITLIRQTRDELVGIAEMKGKYEAEVGDMEWVNDIFPFLCYPDKVDDHDFKLAAAVVGCIDKWLPTQNLGFSWGVKWGDITKYVHTKRAQFR